MPTILDPALRPFHIDVYNAIREAWTDYGSSPSKDELARACRCSSTTVHQAINSLCAKGHLIAPRFAARALKPVDIDRVLIREPIDPWATLVPPSKFWSGVKENTRKNQPTKKDTI